MSPTPPDLIVLGAGPAGLALAASAACRGLSVEVIDPSPEQEWQPTYGAWQADVPSWVPVAHSWDQVEVDLGKGPRLLSGRYLRLDKTELRTALVDKLHTHGGQLRTGRASRIISHGDMQAVHLHEGDTLPSRFVVDATGRGIGSELVSATAFQAAYGLLLEVEEHPWPDGHMTLMDFSVDHLSAAQREGPPTFLYALPLGPNQLFVEETSLAASPALSLDLLRERLAQRLAYLGITARAELEVERCIIPMNTPIPSPSQALPFGASAGLIHPATGYQITRALHLSDPVADALVVHLDRGPQAALRATWAVVWPRALRRTRALHDLGLELLLSLDTAQTQAFFETFFSMPEPSWRAYLSASSGPGEIASAMTKVFARLDPNLRRAIVALALGRGRHALLRVLHPQLGGAS